MNAVLAPISHRKSFFERQDRFRNTLSHLYDHLHTDAEVSISATTLAPKMGISKFQMEDCARSLEAAGILSRRLEYKQGRHYYWKLLLPADKAMEQYNRFLSAETQEASKPHTPTKTGKTLIMEALTENGSFNTVRDLVKAIGVNAQSKKGLHSITHELYRLRSEGKVQFDTTTPKSKAPINIHLNGKHTNGAAIETATMAPVEVAAIKDQAPSDEEVDIPQIVNPLAETYPLITNIVNRRANIEAAARFAEQGGEDDIAIALWERAKTAYTPLEEEQVRLYNAYQICVNR